jgi:hypothetical protein
LGLRSFFLLFYPFILTLIHPENVKVPRGYKTADAANAIRTAALPYGRIWEKRLYYDSRKATEVHTDRSNFDLSGFTLVDCPTRGKKETLDKKMIVDILAFAWDRISKRIPTTVVLISSDGDYSYTLSKLRDIGVKTVVIHAYMGITAATLLDNCDIALSWHSVLYASSSQVIHGELEEKNPLDHPDSVDNPIEGTAQDEDSAEYFFPPPPILSLSRESSISSAVEGAFQLICHCVRSEQLRRSSGTTASLSDIWVLDTNVALLFVLKRGLGKVKGVYQGERQSAIIGGFIEPGRMCLKGEEGESQKITPCEDARYDSVTMKGLLSLQLYLRLTPSGEQLLNGTWTHIAVQMAQDLLNDVEDEK